MNINVLSLFDGISCARVALENLGYTVKYYASEIDKYCIQISQKNYPDTIHIGDVKSATASMFEPIDLLIGGSPCQDLSLANSGRKGLDGKRSGLFWEYVRILHELKPKYFVFENVNSMPKESKRIITETLGVESIMIDAALVSAQRRKRLFWTNIESDVFGNCNIHLPVDRGILLKNILEDTPNVKPVSLTKYNYIIRQLDKGFTAINPPKAITLTATMYDNWKGNYLLYHLGHGFKNELVEKLPDKYPTIHAQQPSNNHLLIIVDNETYTIRMLSPLECERLQSLPDNYTEGISSTRRYMCLGNAFNVEVIRHILSYMR